MKKIISVMVGLMLAVLALSACQSNGNNPQSQGQAQTVQASRQQTAAVPYPVSQLTDSTERRNLREKLLRFNKPDRIGYVYILQFGKPLGYYTIEGKVSSNDSQMTTTSLILQNRHDNGQTVVSAPADDGSYGGNEPGIFFFTTEGALIQTDSSYIYSDQPIPVFVNLPKFNGQGQVQDLTERKKN